MSNLAALENELNQMILQGKALDGFEKFYADNVVMQEATGESFTGKDVNRKREQDFFANVEEFYGAKVLSNAVGDGVTFSEWFYDYKPKGKPRAQLEQVTRRVWKDGKVVQERFYYNAHP